MHYDFGPHRDLIKEKCHCWTVLISLQDKGKIYLSVPNDNQEAAEIFEIELDYGQAVIFDSDTWHAGGVYEEEHFRVHAYMQPAAATRDWRKHKAHQKKSDVSLWEGESEESYNRTKTAEQFRPHLWPLRDTAANVGVPLHHLESPYDLTEMMKRGEWPWPKGKKRGGQ